VILLPGHVELLVNQQPQVLFLRAALNPFSAQPVFGLGIALTHVQDLALSLVELHEVRIGPPLNPVQVPLDGIPSLQYVDRTAQLGVIGKLPNRKVEIDLVSVVELYSGRFYFGKTNNKSE